MPSPVLPPNCRGGCRLPARRVDDGIGRQRSKFCNVPFALEAGKGVTASSRPEEHCNRVLRNLYLEVGLDGLPAHGRNRIVRVRRRTNQMIWNCFNFRHTLGGDLGLGRRPIRCPFSAAVAAAETMPGAHDRVPTSAPYKARSARRSDGACES
jgi:hypothetical protein